MVKRWLTLFVAGSLAILFGANVWSSGVAGAVGHQQSGVVNSSLAIEGKATLTFSCDDSTGKYKVAFANVQIIENDQTTPWPSYAVTWAVSTPDKAHFDSLAVKLSQNTTSGLFKGKQAGTLADPLACATGSLLDGVSSGSSNLHDLWLHGTLT